MLDEEKDKETPAPSYDGRTTLLSEMGRGALMKTKETSEDFHVSNGACGRDYKMISDAQKGHHALLANPFAARTDWPSTDTYLCYCLPLHQ